MLTYLKVSIFCGLPFSLTSKSAAVRFGTAFPCLSLTITSTRTKLMPLVNVGCCGRCAAVCPWPAAVAGFCGCGGVPCAAWNRAAAWCPSSKRDGACWARPTSTAETTSDSNTSSNGAGRMVLGMTCSDFRLILAQRSSTLCAGSRWDRCRTSRAGHGCPTRRAVCVMVRPRRPGGRGTPCLSLPGTRATVSVLADALGGRRGPIPARRKRRKLPLHRSAAFRAPPVAWRCRGALERLEVVSAAAAPVFVQGHNR